MQKFEQLLNFTNDILWSYLIIALLVGCGIWFTFRTRFVQFRMLPEMFRLMFLHSGKSSVSGTRTSGKPTISSFQAFIVALASRIGTGNLAGVATAISVGGPGAVFWMWVMALFGASTAFVESTLAQLFKRSARDGFIGGPAYYMKFGLKRPWLGSIFGILMIVTFSYANNCVQSNTICAAWSKAFGLDGSLLGLLLTLMTLVIIFGGIQRVAKASMAIVPFMAVGYLLVAIFIVAVNFREIPGVFVQIFESAFGLRQAAGGMLGATIMQGVKRGLFSNEAGEGSAPHAAATATVSHPVKQGLIQALGVFTDTLVVCSCTAFIVLVSGVDIHASNGIQLTQDALTHEIGTLGSPFIAVAIFLFAYSSMIANYYYGESNVRFLTSSPRVLFFFRLTVGVLVMAGALMTLNLAWAFVDLCMAFLTLCNLIAIVPLFKHVRFLLKDYTTRCRAGEDPQFSRTQMPELEADLEAW